MLQQLMEQTQRQQIEIDIRDKRERELSDKLTKAEAVIMNIPSLGLSTSKVSSKLSDSSSHYGSVYEAPRPCLKPQRELVRAEHLVGPLRHDDDDEFFLTKISNKRQPLNELPLPNYGGSRHHQPLSRFNENEPQQEYHKGRQPARGSLYSDQMQSGRGGRGFQGGRGGQQMRGDYQNFKR